MSASDQNAWIQFADADLVAARLLLESSVPPRIPAWHAQQAAEKALKAVLVSWNAPVVKTHDVADLARITALAGLPSLADLAELTAPAVQYRYPDDLPDVSAEEAQWAVETAEAALAAVRAALAG